MKHSNCKLKLFEDSETTVSTLCDVGFVILFCPYRNIQRVSILPTNIWKSQIKVYCVIPSISRFFKFDPRNLLPDILSFIRSFNVSKIKSRGRLSFHRPRVPLKCSSLLFVRPCSLRFSIEESSCGRVMRVR